MSERRIDYRYHAILVAIGIDARGTKHVFGMREGTTENRTVAGALLSDLVARGLAAGRPLLFAIDRGKALRKPVRRMFGHTGWRNAARCTIDATCCSICPRNCRPR